MLGLSKLRERNGEEFENSEEENIIFKALYQFEQIIFETCLLDEELLNIVSGLYRS